jgi:hypothetical protein
MIFTKPICFNCKHFDFDKSNCTAFPKEIPFEILNGENNHSNPLPDQNNNIVFEKIQKTKGGDQPPMGSTET